VSATRIYLVRHAAAEQSSPSGDAGRRLTEEGRTRFGDLARALPENARPVRVLSSPATRARETAELLAAAAGAAEVVEEPRLASGRSSAGELLELARDQPDGTALVGHNPEVGEAIALAAGKASPVPPGTVAAVDLDGPRVHLAWMASP
jgi:phosphohistidine phosphatase